MDTQLALIEGSAPPRPQNDDDVAIHATADALLPDIISWLGKDYREAEREDIRRSIIEALNDAMEWDGFKLAKEFDSSGWECDSSLVEILDGASHENYMAVEKMIRQWVADWGVTPEFKVGDRVTGFVRGTWTEGEITGVNIDRAEYVVFCESAGHVRSGTGSYGYVLPYEKVKASGVS